MSLVKIPPPRQLTNNETLDTLTHWKSIFRNYFRRDAIYKQFLASDCAWDPSVPDTYGFRAGGDMTAEERKDALVDFLSNLAGFLPHSYLTSKLLENTKALKDCWNIIEEHYNVQVTPETMLDFETMKKEPGENYRQFYERLLQHARLHLAPVGAKVENTTAREADKMSISLMNHIALQWLRKINIQLLQIVKTEYSNELRSGEQLAALVPRIAPNIDSLLTRYSSANVAKVNIDTADGFNSATAEEDPDNNSVRWTNFRGRGRGGKSFRGRGGNNFQGSSSSLFCAGCFSMGKQLETFVNFKHKPAECPRQRAVARFLQASGKEEEEE